MAARLDGPPPPPASHSGVKRKSPPQAHQCSDSDHLPGIVAHEGIGALADLLRLIAKLRRRVRHRALGGHSASLPWREPLQCQASRRLSTPWSSPRRCRESYSLGRWHSRRRSLPGPILIASFSSLDPAAQAHQECNHRADQKHDEQDFRDAGCADSDPAETKKRGDQRDDEKDHGIVKHVRTFLLRQPSAAEREYGERFRLKQSVPSLPYVGLSPRRLQFHNPRMKTLLIVYHSMTGGTLQMAQAAAAGARTERRSAFALRAADARVPICSPPTAMSSRPRKILPASLA